MLAQLVSSGFEDMRAGGMNTVEGDVRFNPRFGGLV